LNGYSEPDPLYLSIQCLLFESSRKIPKKNYKGEFEHLIQTRIDELDIYKVEKDIVIAVSEK
jgi:hypothetical protein